MTSEHAKAPLRPVSAEELEDALSFALRFDGRKRVHSGDELMARVTAGRLAKYLDRAGFVLMRKPPAQDSSAPTQ